MKNINRQIAAYLKYCAEVRGMSATTLRAKQYILERFARETGVKDLKHLTNQVFDEYVARLAKNQVSGSSINTYNATILAFVKYCKNAGLRTPLDNALVQKQKTTKRMRKYYTEKEVRRVLESADPEAGLMIRIMFETGMRIAELTRLRRADFLGRQVVFVGKGGKLREVYIKHPTRELLDEYVAKTGVENYLWGTTLTGEPPTEHTIRKKLQRAFLEAGFLGFYPHALRHSFATHLQSKGATVAEIKEMMGHSSVATTERYLHGFDGAMRGLFEKYG